MPTTSLAQMDTVFSVTKGSFAKTLKRLFGQRQPQLLNQLSAKHLILAQAFIDGYLACFNKMKEDPLNQNEIEDLLLNETLQFIEQLFEKKSVQ